MLKNMSEGREEKRKKWSKSSVEINPMHLKSVTLLILAFKIYFLKLEHVRFVFFNVQ